MINRNKLLSFMCKADATIDDLLHEINAQISAAVAAEREACARQCDDISIRYPLDVFPDTGHLTGNSAKMARITACNCAREIRNVIGRGDAQPAPRELTDSECEALILAISRAEPGILLYVHGMHKAIRQWFRGLSK
jgi:hypothetical protein